MVLTKNYVMSVEFAKKTGMAMANVSMVKKELEESENFSCIKKVGQGTYIDKRSTALPEYFQKALGEHEFTSMHNKIPLIFFTKELGITKLELYGLRDTNPEIIQGINFLESVELIEFNSNFVKILNKSIPYILSEQDFAGCHKEGLLDGHVKLCTGNYLIWYYV